MYVFNIKLFYSGNTAFILAARYGHFNILEFLLSKGASADQKNDWGMIQLYLSFYLSIHLLTYLIIHLSFYSYSFLFLSSNLYIYLSIYLIHVGGILRFLLSNVIFLLLYSGETALIFAARRGHLKVLKFLLNKGASVDEKNISGKIQKDLLYMKGIDMVKYNFFLFIYLWSLSE